MYKYLALNNRTVKLRLYNITISNVRTYTSASSPEEYDLVVIGGGSGGLACAKEAADLGVKVAVLDYVHPSVQGTVWGLGGTCVNVGCIPKKLMHHAALLGHALDDSRKYGWNLSENSEKTHSWATLRHAVQQHVKSLNWGHRVQLKEKAVDYINAYGEFVDKDTVRAKSKKEEKLLKSKYFLLATGMRPHYPKEIIGVEHCISSDDIFSLDNPPGKTLVIGGSYVALECAGFLTSLGYDTSVMIRSIPLRGFDQEMSELVLDHLRSECGVNVLRGCVPSRVEREEEGRGLRVTYQDGNTSLQHSHTYHTVLLAVGRRPQTATLSLSAAGIESDASGYILTTDTERTTNDKVYAVGDILQGRQELTPVAVKAGRLLARRLFSGDTTKMDYNNVATTVFTPLEYSCCGVSEERGVELWGEDNIDVYHAFYKPLEFSVSGRHSQHTYIKCICARDGGSEDSARVIGLHYTGPHAAEVMQGFSVAIRCGVTWSQLRHTVGIHPSSAEEVVKLRHSKRSGVSPHVTDC